MRARLIALSILSAIVSFAVASAVLAHPAQAHRASKQAVKHVHLVVKSDAEHGKKGPDGKWHDAFLPASFTVKPGTKVIVSVRNYDEGAHSFSAPGLHVNVLIRGGGATKPRTTRFTFVAPKKAGKYQWWCNQPCDPWAMAHLGYMRGVVVVRS